MTERRYSEAEVAQIFERATTGNALQSSRAAEGMTLAELQGIGAEVGIPAEQIAEAALSLGTGSATPAPQFLGMATGVGHVVPLARKLTDEEWELFIVDVREAFNARGTMTSHGSLRQWNNGNLQVLHEPTDDGHRIRFRTVKGDAAGRIGIGLAVGGLSVVGTLLMLAGAVTDPGMLVGFGVLGAAGVGLAGTTALRLPRWARVRKAQMEALGARASALALRAPRDPG